MVQKNNTCSSLYFGVSILFYLLWNMVWFSVQQHIEHVYILLFININLNTNIPREILTQKFIGGPLFCSFIMTAHI